MRKKSLWMPFMVACALVFTLMLWAAGCSDSTGPENGDGADTTPPALSSVTPADANHIEVLFDEEVDGLTADHRHNYNIHRFGPLPPMEATSIKSIMDYQDTLHVNTAALLSDGKTVLLSLYPEMGNNYNYHLIADNIKDLNGNSMTEPDTMDFVGVDAPDETPPEIIHRTPGPGEPGVGLAQPVVVTFSEPMDESSVAAAFSWTYPPSGNVDFYMEDREGNIFIFMPISALNYDEEYTVSFAANTAMDYSMNYLAASSWSFTTTDEPDLTPPTVVSTTPADGAINVPLDITLQIEFSEPVDPYSMSEFSIIMTPNPGEGILTWTEGGRTLNFYPDTPLLADMTYNLVIVEGAVDDFAGNPLAGTYSVTFTTGAVLPTGGFSGTISGDPNSSAASDPEGAIIAAFLVNIITWDGGDNGQPPIAGGAVADHNGDYEIEHLEDGTYWPVALMDTDGDGEVTMEYGDAFGVYGIDFGSLFQDPEPDSVIISGGNKVYGVDFGLFDQSAIWGEVSYGGTTYQGDLQNYDYYVGVFDTASFNPANPNPDYGTEAENIMWHPEFVVNELENWLTDGSYYVGAYMDVNYNSEYNPGTDPVGFYEDGGEMVTVNVENGEDTGDILIILYDPEAGASQVLNRVKWAEKETSGNKMRPELRRALELIRKTIKEQYQKDAAD